MAVVTHLSSITGFCNSNLEVNEKKYSNVKLYVMMNLCADIILGQDFQSKHKNVTINYGGSEPPLVIGSLSTLNVNPPKLFEHLST